MLVRAIALGGLAGSGGLPIIALSVLGKILTTKVRRLISSFSRSSMLVDFRCLWCCGGKYLLAE